MRDRKKRNIMIGSLCALLVFMGIGYAIISQMLTIRGVSTVAGDWNIYIDSITPNAVGTGVSINESVGLDKVSASFEANLYAPGDKVEYKVVVKNDGNIDAKLGAVNQHVTNDTEGIVKYSNTLENGYILRHGESYVFYVTTEIEESIEELPSENTVRAVLDLKLNFTQYTGSGSGGDEDPEVKLLKWGDISANGDESVIWNYYSNGYVEIVGNGTQVDTSKSLVEEIISSFVPDLSTDTVSFIQELVEEDETFVLMYYFGSFYYPGMADNEEDYLALANDFIEGISNPADKMNALVADFKGLGFTQITKIDIKAPITSIPHNLLNYTGNYEISVPNSVVDASINWSRSIIDLRNTGLDNSDFDDYELFNGLFGTIYMPSNLTGINHAEVFIDVSLTNFYFPENFTTIGRNDIFTNSSQGNSLFFYLGESSIPQETKNNIQSMISNGKIANVYYGCDDANADSCNKR